jgi:hypothetical protein
MQAAQSERAEVDLNSKLLLDAQLVLSQASSSSSSSSSDSISSSSVVQRIERALQHMIAAGVQPDDVSFIGMIEACAERQVRFLYYVSTCNVQHIEVCASVCMHYSVSICISGKLIAHLCKCLHTSCSRASQRSCLLVRQ